VAGGDGQCSDSPQQIEVEKARLPKDLSCRTHFRDGSLLNLSGGIKAPHGSSKAQGGRPWICSQIHACRPCSRQRRFQVRYSFPIEECQNFSLCENVSGRIGRIPLWKAQGLGLARVGPLHGLAQNAGASGPMARGRRSRSIQLSVRPMETGTFYRLAVGRSIAGQAHERLDQVAGIVRIVGVGAAGFWSG